MVQHERFPYSGAIDADGHILICRSIAGPDSWRSRVRWGVIPKNSSPRRIRLM